MIIICVKDVYLYVLDNMAEVSTINAYYKHVQ